MWPITNGGAKPKAAGRVRRKVSCPAPQRQHTSQNGRASPPSNDSSHHGSFSVGSPILASSYTNGQQSGSFFSPSSSPASAWSTAWRSFTGQASTSPSPCATPPSFFGARRQKKSFPLLVDSNVDATPAHFSSEHIRRPVSCAAVAGRLTSSGEIGSYASTNGPFAYSSPAADSGKRRRSVRKQRYYGSVEMMVSVDASGQVKNMGRFRVEPAADNVQPDVYQGESGLPTSPVMLEDPEVETRWYYRYFLGREHQNFAGVDNQKAPFFLSVLMEDGAVDGLRCRAILWKSTGSKKLVFPYHVHSSMSSQHTSQTVSAGAPSSQKDGSTPGGAQTSSTTGSVSNVSTSGGAQKPLTARSIVQKFPGMYDLSHGLKEITDPKLQKDLLVLEEQEGAVNFKFGVIYAKHKQESDDDMLSNETGSQAFENFLHILGDHVQLQGWNKFRGGLDAKTNSTGNQSVYTVYEGHEIIFHVSTLLPYSQGNKQQVERKRHIGNDIVNIVFEDEGDPADPSFSPTAMKSHFTHIFAVVTYDKNLKCYRLWVFSEETVPAYGPFLISPPEFYDQQQFREFLLTKLINAEKAAFRSHVFSEKRYRTTDTLLKDMYMEYLKKEVCRGSLHKVTEAVVRHLKSPKSKEFDNNLVEFVRMGEHLKLTKSMSGEAPNAVLVPSYYRKQPWEPQLICQEMPLWEFASSDSWGNRSLVLATDDAGTLLVNEGVCTALFDQSCQVQQLNVLENFGLLLVRCEKGKDGYVSLFTLSHIRACIHSGHTLQKKHCQEHKVAATKGCQLYAVTGNNSLRLSLSVCVGRKMFVLRWNSTQISTQSSSTPDIAKNFEVIKEVSLADEPLALCVFESGLQANVKACACTKNGLDLVDFSDGSVTNLYRCPLTKTSITSLLAFCDVESEDILLTYDNTTLVFDLCEENSDPLVISWTANPRQIAYCFPFVLSFGTDAIEIRLAINGNLFTSLYMPGVRLLAAKEDIFFAIDRLELPFYNNNDSPKTTRKHTVSETKSNSSSHSAAAQAITGTRKWCKLYKIPMKNLLRGGQQSGNPQCVPSTQPLTNVNEDDCVINQTPSAPQQPQVRFQNGGHAEVGLQCQNRYAATSPSGRHGKNENFNNISNGGGGHAAFNGQQAAIAGQLGQVVMRGSVGSDSGWSSSQGLYSTTSSLDVDASLPSSPAGADSGDVLL